MFRATGIVVLVLIFGLLVIGFIDLFVKDVPNQCEMTYMYMVPEFIGLKLSRQVERMFPNYHLFIYGEGQYADTLRLSEYNGNPVIFVPGNAGNYKQVRSLASVGLMMSPGKPSHLNYFTIDYNEELSAFFGDKLDFQTRFLFYSVRRIVDLYEHVPNIRLILVGHSVGGILIKSLLTKPYFRPYLDKISLVITLATPHSHPAISYDLRTLDFYRQTNEDFGRHRATHLSHLNFLSIGGSFQDHIVRPDLIRLNSDYPFDRWWLTTTIPDVWVSADHLCIVWCRQLIVKLNRMFYDLIDPERSVLFHSPEVRQKIIDYHLAGRFFSKQYPHFQRSPDTVRFSGLIQWTEFQERLVRLSFNKVVRKANYLVPLKPLENVVVSIEGIFKPETLSVCKIENLTNNNSTPECQGDAQSLYTMMHLAPSNLKQTDRHVGNINSDLLLKNGHTHLVISFSPATQSTAYSLIIDRFTASIRRRKISLPMPTGWSIFKPQLAFSKLIAQEQLFFELSLEGFDHVWQAFWIQFQTRACYHNNSTYSGYVRAIHSDVEEFLWPLQPYKGHQMEFTLAPHYHNRSSITKPKLLMYLEPSCGFDVLVKFSLTGSLSRLLKHYFMILVSMMVSVVILVICVQFSNICSRYTYSDEDLERFQNMQRKQLPDGGEMNIERKCFMMLSATEIMLDRHYFSFCLVQIVPGALICLQIIKSFYSQHDLIHLAGEPLETQALIAFLMFLFAYSSIFVSMVLVNHLANNFANGLLFFRIRFKMPTSTIKFTKTAWTIFNLTTSAMFLYSFIFSPPLTYYLIHFFFTLLMLFRYVRAKSLELRVGRTTSTSLVTDQYPLLFGLLLIATILHLPHCIDWTHARAGSFRTQGFSYFTSGGRAAGSISIFSARNLIEYSILAALLGFIRHTYVWAFNLNCRVKNFSPCRSQKLLNISLLAVAMANLVAGTLALENLTISLTITLLVVVVQLRIWNHRTGNQIFNNNHVIQEEEKDQKHMSYKSE